MRTISRYPGEWHYIDSREELTVENLTRLNPRYVFFLHWSYIVPKDVLTAFECVVFHMTDVPYGRGGSPLQNLIVRGHKATKLTALKMTEGLDAGPVYTKVPMSLDGNAEQILIRASELSAEIIKGMIANEPTPTEQQGEVTPFKRRKPEESRLPESEIEKVYDHIRMLDAEGYPPAFIEYGGLRMEFKKANMYDNKVVAEVTITPMEEEV